MANWQVQIMNIVRVVPEDWQKIRGSIKSIEKQVFERNIRFAEYKGDFKPFQNSESINLLLKNNRGIAGYLMSSRIEEDRRFTRYPHYGKYNTYCVDSIAIRSEFQGKGLGRKLLRSFIGKAKRKKMRRIVLDATSAGMLKLAESEGFKVKKFYRRWEGLRPSWFMEKKL